MRSSRQEDGYRQRYVHIRDCRMEVRHCQTVIQRDIQRNLNQVERTVRHGTEDVNRISKMTGL